MAKVEKKTEATSPPLNVEETPKEAEVVAIIQEPQREILPVLTKDFGLTTHKFRQFSAIAPTGTQKEDLGRPEFWKHVAAQLQMGYEIRILSEDYAWVAYGVVTFKHSNNIKVTLTSYTQIEDISYDTGALNERYITKQRGVLKWCIVDTETGKNVFTNIPSQGKALLELEEYRTTLLR